MSDRVPLSNSDQAFLRECGIQPDGIMDCLPQPPSGETAAERKTVTGLFDDVPESKALEAVEQLARELATREGYTILDEERGFKS